MTNWEAKIIVQSIPDKIWNSMQESEREAIEVMFKANDKQISNKSTFFCRDCGESILDGAVYCSRCGRKVV